MDMRVGSAIVVHAFSADTTRLLMLACLPWPGEQGLDGHSDADVIAHAVADALLIASGIGELGTIFGVDKPEYAGASGELLLQETQRLLDDEGWDICNVSVQLIGQKPRFSPRKKESEEKMTEVVGAPVSVSATTTDHLGALGRIEGLGALATALVQKKATVFC